MPHRHSVSYNVGKASPLSINSSTLSTRTIDTQYPFLKMHFLNTIMCLVPWLIVVPSSQALAIRQAGLAGVLYTLDNNPAGASIAAMGLSENGTIMGTMLTPTGGNGSNGVVAPGQPAVGSTFGAHSVVAEDGVRCPMLVLVFSRAATHIDTMLWL